MNDSLSEKIGRIAGILEALQTQRKEDREEMGRVHSAITEIQRELAEIESDLANEKGKRDELLNQITSEFARMRTDMEAIEAEGVKQGNRLYGILEKLAIGLIGGGAVAGGSAIF